MVGSAFYFFEKSVFLKHPIDHFQQALTKQFQPVAKLWKYCDEAKLPSCQFSESYCYHSPQDQPQQTSRRLHQQEKQQSSLQKMNGWLAQQEDFENNTNITFGIPNNPGIWAPTCKIPPEMEVAPRYLLLIVAPLLPQLTSLSKLRRKKAIREGLKKVFFRNYS